MLEFRNVNLGYGQSVVVENISSRFNVGEIVTIVGKNGSGKSTILRSLFGLAEIISGEVLLDGQNIKSMGPGLRSQKLSVLFAGQHVSKEINVDDILNFSIDRRCLGEREKKNIKEKYITLFNVKDLMGKLVSSLSDGMLQRILITRAFCLETPIIYLDEPTTYLDIESQIEISEIINSLSSKKLILINTHNPIWVKTFKSNIYKIDERKFKKTSLKDLNLDTGF